MMRRIKCLAVCATMLVASVVCAVTAPETVVFPKTLAVGEQDQQVITLSNDTDSAVQFLEFDLSAKGFHASFYVDVNGGTCKLGSGLEAHQQCTLSLHFIARRTGVVKDTLTIVTLTGSLASPQRNADWINLEGHAQ